MKKGRKFLCIPVLVAVGIFCFSGCGGEQLQKVRVSEVTHSVFYAPQYVAVNKGFFAEEGIELELSNGQGADKVMSAVLSDHIDIGFAGPEASIYVYNEGKDDYTQVFAQMTQRDGAFLVGRKPEAFFDWKHLKDSVVLPGRKGGVPYMALEYVIKSKGLTPGQDVMLDDSIQFALMAGAFTAGTGDYVALFEPTASMVEKEGKGYVLSSIGQEAGEIPYTAYFAKKSYLQNNADTVQKFTNAIYKGQHWVAHHSAREIAQVLQPSFPDTDLELLTTVVQRYQDIDAWSKDPVMKASSFELLQTVMTSAGELAQKAPYEQIVNNTYAERAKEIITQ